MSLKEILKRIIHSLFIALLLMFTYSCTNETKIYELEKLSRLSDGGSTYRRYIVVKNPPVDSISIYTLVEHYCKSALHKDVNTNMFIFLKEDNLINENYREDKEGYFFTNEIEDNSFNIIAVSFIEGEELRIDLWKEGVPIESKYFKK